MESQPAPPSHQTTDPNYIMCMYKHVVARALMALRMVISYLQKHVVVTVPYSILNET